MKRLLVSVFVLLLCSPLSAQEAPPPRKMPRTPVQREAIAGHKPQAPPSREVKGTATIIDGEKLKVADLDLRLFGIVPPQLSASFGPQARATLDELTQGGAVSCTIRDRDREERFLATCHTSNGNDLALELLRRGLAVTARGSVASTDLSAPYIAAEQAATAQKLGLWSVVMPAAAPVPEAVRDAVRDTPKDAAKDEHRDDHAADQALTSKDSGKGKDAVSSKDAVSDAKTDLDKPLTAAEADKDEQAKSAAIIDEAIKSAPVIAAPVTVSSAPAPNFLERYQMLITAALMLLTALGIFIAVVAQRVGERHAEMQAIAAALRGELMAARSVCYARLRASLEIDDKAIVWPRLRSTLYQAYVGRLGQLGADLARRIASIYGQASDYASFYDGDSEMRSSAMPKRQALQGLMQHIDDVLPRLAAIERSGRASSGGTSASPRPPSPVSSTVLGNPAAGVRAPVAETTQRSPLSHPSPSETLSSRGLGSSQPPVASSQMSVSSFSGFGASAVASPAPPAAGRGSVVEAVATETQAGPAVMSATPVPPAAPQTGPSTQFWTVVRKLARAPWGEKKASAANDPIAEYTALIEEEMKRFSLREEDDEMHASDGGENWPPRSHEVQ